MAWLEEKTMTTNQYKKIKPLIVGVGIAGKRHLEAQLNLGWKTGVYSTNPKTVDPYRNNPQVIIFNNLLSLFEKGECHFLKL